LKGKRRLQHLPHPESGVPGANPLLLVDILNSDVEEENEEEYPDSISGLSPSNRICLSRLYTTKTGFDSNVPNAIPILLEGGVMSTQRCTCIANRCFRCDNEVLLGRAFWIHSNLWLVVCFAKGTVVFQFYSFFYLESTDDFIKTQIYFLLIHNGTR
jgi:hypothetical protein